MFSHKTVCPLGLLMTVLLMLLGPELVAANNISDSNQDEAETGVLTPAGIYRYKHLGSLTKKILLPNGEDINTWQAPYNLSNRFVMYQAGIDYEGRAVGVMEIDKWFVKQVFEEGHEKEFAYYSIQMLHNIVKVVKVRNQVDPSVTMGVLILDFNDLQLDQILHLATIRYVLNLALEYHQLLDNYVGEMIVINVNRAAQILIDLLRPIYGAFFARVFVFGNNPAKWIPELLRRFPPEILPKWYGGSENFKPIKVYG